LHFKKTCLNQKVNHEFIGNVEEVNFDGVS
jgi:hypothetical protein